MTEHPDVPAFVAALRRPNAYPWPAAEVGFVETHISWVLLAGDRVVKVKRPVGYAFVDYTTLEKRRSACHDEVRLNRRLTDGVYLGVVPITRRGDTYRVDGAGETVEWATLMRRLPADRMLDALLRAGQAPPDLADRLADRLVPFHLERAPACDGDPEAVARSAIEVVTDNLDELIPFRGVPLGAAELDLVTRAMRRLIDERPPLLVGRARDGWIREGHGDLRCEHVCLEAHGATQVYDCVEFNRGLRCADVASDLAFLLMDLHRLDAPGGTVDRLLERYAAAGADLPVGLLRFSWAHRALVRAKVACLRLHDAEGDEAVALRRKAADNLHLACARALTVRPALIAMTGLSGSGKSTVAHDLARAIGAERVVSDVVRKALARGGAAVGGGDGIYTPAWTEATYAELIAAGERTVAAGRPAVLDGTFLDSALRERAAEVARRRGVPFVLVETVCDNAVVERRLEERAARGDSVSDAGVAVYRRQRERFLATPPAVPEGAITATIDTTADGPASLDPVLAALASVGVIDARIRDDGPLVR